MILLLSVNIGQPAGGVRNTDMSFNHFTSMVPNRTKVHTQYDSDLLHSTGMRKMHFQQCTLALSLDTLDLVRPTGILDRIAGMDIA